MFGIAKFAMRSPMSSAVVASGLLLASFVPVVLLSILGGPFTVALLVASASISSLTMLRFGVASSIRTIALGIALLAVTGLIAGLGPLNLLFFVVLFWGPVGVAAYVLRRTVRLDLAMATLALMAVGTIAGLYLIYPDQSQLWQAPVDHGLEGLKFILEQGAAGTAATPGVTPSGAASAQNQLDPQKLMELERTRQLMINYMTPIFIVSLFLVAVLSLLQARYWQARLFNPGGFQQEFHGLKFGQAMALGGICLCLAAAFTGWAFLVGLSFVVVCLFMFQGLAVLHSMVKQGRLNQGWLVGVYVLLLILQTTVVLAAALGMLDNWLNLAKR